MKIWNCATRSWRIDIRYRGSRYVGRPSRARRSQFAVEYHQLQMPASSDQVRGAHPMRQCRRFERLGSRRRVSEGFRWGRTDVGDPDPSRDRHRGSRAAHARGAQLFRVGMARAGGVERRLRQQLPREAVAITVNSMASRSQDQLHLRIDCVDKEVAASLASYSGALDTQWRAMTVDLKGRRYWARELESDDLTESRLSCCSRTGSTARKPRWGFGRSPRSARISLASPGSFCSPTAPSRRSEATPKIYKIATARSREQNRNPAADASNGRPWRALLRNENASLIVWVGIRRRKETVPGQAA